ncbi:Translation initiation factor eIF-2B subunit alpha, partial [Trichinella pseudospiralis]
LIYTFCHHKKMQDNEIAHLFTSLCISSKRKSPAIASIETLYECVKRSQATTLVGLSNELKKAIEIMLNTNYSYTAVSSASELFMRFISLTTLDKPDQDFSDCVKVLLERGQIFLCRVAASRQKIASLCRSFIRNGSKVMVHARSCVVLRALCQAAEDGKQLEVFITESKPSNGGSDFYDCLRQAGIQYMQITDSSIGYFMENIDFVLVGAEGVVESGGIINKIGTLTIAICAKAMNKPFYVLVESIKFVKSYPLTQSDLTQHFTKSCEKSSEHPRVDYTPAKYITLLFTDLGILTPTAVSDELIKLYL